MDDTCLPRIGKVDLHLHSYASNVTTFYAANALNIPESHSDPHILHARLKQRGMDLVTLTDHNAIDGGRLLLDAGHEDVFLSSELTCRFPDGCNIHVTVVNVTESQFAECNRLRANLFELVAYLEQQIDAEVRRPEVNRLAYFMTHPLTNTDNRPHGREGALTLEHLEIAALLLPGFEVRNGARTRVLNELTQAWLGSLDANRMSEFAGRHGLVPRGDRPWVKFVTGGSDDHAGINPGRTWTEFDYRGLRPTPNDLVASMRAHTTRPGGQHGGPIVLAHALMKLLHDGARRERRTPEGPLSRLTGGRISLARLAPPGPIDTLLGLVFEPDGGDVIRKATLAARAFLHRHVLRTNRLGVPFEQHLEAEAYRLLSERDFVARLEDPALTTDDRIFLVVSTLVDRIFVRYVDNIRAAGMQDPFGAVKDLVALGASTLFVSLPYFVSYFTQSADSVVATAVRESSGLPRPERLALFTDTYFDINGVSATIKRMLRESVKRNIDFTVVTCLSETERERRLADPETARFVAEGRLKIVTSTSTMGFPEYDGLQIHFPPLLEVVRFVEESGFTKIHISTPGVVGLSGLLAAKLLHLETAATYHTSFPEYVENYTQDVALEDLAWKYMISFYHAVDEVLVPSRFIARLLHKRGLRNRKLLILDRWVDCERFTPAKRADDHWDSHGIPDATRKVKFVYVGRVGIEKNLALLAEAFRALCARRDDAHLVIIGDGPYRATLEERLAGLPVTWTGFLEGDALPRAVASCDVKLFPSTTDTWGNAPLEAQASGLPVIVSEVGGPSELMRDGETGIVVSGREVGSLVAAMETLMNPDVRARMGEAARQFCLENRVDAPFLSVFDAAAYRRRVASLRAASAEAGGARLPVSTAVLELESAQTTTPLNVAEIIYA